MEKIAIVYSRVSTEEQSRGFSLESQKERCENKAYELGADKILYFEDAGVSGEVYERPSLMDALATLKSNDEIRLFICTDPDRLSRDLVHLLVISDQIEKSAELVFTDFKRESTAEGQLFYAIRGAISQFEKEMIKRRTVGGKIKKARKKQWTHWPGIYGYDYDKGLVTVNKEEAEVVRLIFRLGAEIGVIGICNILAAKEIRSPRADSIVWSKTTVRRILENETYYTGITHIRKYDSAGVHLNKYRSEAEKAKRSIRPREEWISMSVPTIIDEELFHLAERKRENARRRSSKSKEFGFLLSGLLRCGVCGKTWHGHSGAKHQYYVCTYKSPGPRKGSGLERCPTRFVHCEKFDTTIWNLIHSWMLSDESIDSFEKFIRRQTTEVQSMDPILTDLKARRERLNQEENNLLERVRKEKSSRLKQKINEGLDAIALQLDEIDRVIEQMQVKEDKFPGTINRTIVNDLRSRFGNPSKMAWADKYVAIHEAISEISVHSSGDSYHLRVYFKK